MVYTRRRRVLRTKRRLFMRKRKMNISRPLTQGKLYKFKRTCQALPFYFDGSNWAQYSVNTITNSVTAPSIAGIFKFRLEDVPNATDFTQLYEQFKITGVKLRFIPYLSTESSSGVSNGLTDTIALAIDRGANDFAVVNPSFNSLLENQDVKLHNSQRGFSMWIGTPTFHQPADGLTQGTYKSGWLDGEIVASRNVDYHGLKWSFPQSRTEAQSCGFRVYATYYISCRNPQ